jgi:hypothetical protein
MIFTKLILSIFGECKSSQKERMPRRLRRVSI